MEMSRAGPPVHSNCNSLTTALTPSRLVLQLEILSLAKPKSRRCVWALHGTGRPRQLMLPHPPHPLPTASTLEKTVSLSPTGSQLPISPRPGVGLRVQLPVSWRDLMLLGLPQVSCVVSRLLWVHMQSSTPSVSYTLSSLSSSMTPEL